MNFGCHSNVQMRDCSLVGRLKFNFWPKYEEDFFRTIGVRHGINQGYLSINCTKQRLISKFVRVPWKNLARRLKAASLGSLGRPGL